MAAGDGGKKVWDTELPREDQDPLQQLLGRWDTGVPTDADVAAGQQGAGGASQCEAPEEWSGSEEDGVCDGARSGIGGQRRKRERRGIQRLRESRGGRHSSRYDTHMGGRRTAGVSRHLRGGRGEGCSVTRESHYETWRRLTRRMEVGVCAGQVLGRDGTGIRADYAAGGSISRRAQEQGRTTA